jgi:hypothetical protein
MKEETINRLLTDVEMSARRGVTTVTNRQKWIDEGLRRKVNSVFAGAIEAAAANLKKQLYEDRALDELPVNDFGLPEGWPQSVEAIMGLEATHHERAALGVGHKVGELEML